MSHELEGVRVAFVVANEGIEEVELSRPWDQVAAAGGEPAIVAPKAGEVQMMNHLDRSGRRRVDRTTDSVRVDDFDALVLPGGVANPDQLRLDGHAIEFIKAMFEAAKPAAVICHGPWSLVEADLVRGRTLTSWPSLQTDIHNAGGHWVDEEVHVCREGTNLLISSRKPDDLPAFCSALVEHFQTPHGQGA